MELDFLVDGEVRVIITYYLLNFVSDFPETMQGRVAAPATYHLFTVTYNTNRNLLDE